MKLSEIHCNPKNPRLIKDDRFKKLCQSIKEFPKMMALRPIIVDSEGLILGGNMRFKALKELGYKEVPDEWVKSDSELTEAEKQRFIIADNVGFGEYDWEMLQNEWDIEELVEWGLDIPNFDVETLEAEEDNFDVPEGGIETDIVLGDLFKIGNHFLLCGDALNSDDCSKLMQNKRANCIITDPPYEIDFNYSNSVLYSENAHVFVFNNDRAIIRQLKESPFVFKKFFVFNHSGCAIPQEGGNECFLDHILISHEINGVPSLRFNKGDGLRTVIRGEYRKSINHKHEKPANLLSDLVKGYSNENDIILDFFGGSGSLMSVCEQLNRNCYTMELEPKNCQIILDRMKKCYNLEAVKNY